MKPISQREVALDVIALVKAKKIVAETGVYCQPQDANKMFGKSLKSYLTRKTTKPCNACAWGALFLGYVYRKNEVTVNHAYSSSQMGNQLENVFSWDELKVIESAFERSAMTYSEAVEDAVWFGQQFDNDERRLLAIMRNIVKYDTFRPDKARKAAERKAAKLTAQEAAA